MAAGQKMKQDLDVVLRAIVDTTPNSVHGAQVCDFAGKQCVAGKFTL
jgi:hypothetical protein